MVAQRVRHQQRRQRIRQPGHVLGHVDERDRQIAGAMQDLEAEGADQHHLARGRRAVLPQHNGPGHQSNGQDDGRDRVQEPDLFEIEQAAAARRHFPAHSVAEAAEFPRQAAERTHQRHVADDVDHLAVDGRRLVGEIVMQGLAGRSQPKDRHHQHGRNDTQAAGHERAHGEDEQHRSQGRDTRRHDVPNEHVLDGEHRVRGGGDAARQRAGQALGKITRRMAG
jgi:hypothetical protein